MNWAPHQTTPYSAYDICNYFKFHIWRWKYWLVSMKNVPLFKVALRTSSLANTGQVNCMFKMYKNIMVQIFYRDMTKFLFSCSRESANQNVEFFSCTLLAPAVTVSICFWNNSLFYSEVCFVLQETF